MSKKTKAKEFANTGYDIHITGRHLLITDPMKAYAIEKISKIERFTDRIIDVAVTMDVQRQVHRVDIKMKVDHILIKSQGSSDNMYASIDFAVEKIERQLLRYKTKISDHTAKKLSSIDMNVNVLRPSIEDETDAVNEEIEDESRTQLIEKYRPHTVVTQETIPLKTLNYDEAIMKLELSGDTFLVFRSENDQKLKIIYKRKDSNLGIIEPEV